MMVRMNAHSRWRPILAICCAVTVLLAACSSDSDDGSAATSTASTSTSSTSTTEPGGPSLTVEELLETRPEGTVVVAGMAIDQAAGTLLCEALAESFPPQCGGRWIVVVNPEVLDVAWQSEQGVEWVDQPVELTGELFGQRFAIGGETASVEPTDADRAVVEALTELARGQADMLDVEADGGTVSLGLANELYLERSVDELSDHDAWLLDIEPFRGRVAPFSALELLAEDRPTEILVGPHDHCAAPPVPAPDGLGDVRRISVEPTNTTSCLEWFSVDLFVGDDGALVAVTLDLWEP